MTKKRRLILIAAVTLAAGVGIWGAFSYTLSGGHLYPRHREVLDLREQSLTVEEYDALAEKLPDTRIVWQVPFCGSASSDAESLTVTSLSDEDAELLEYFPDLATLDAVQCTDYSVLMLLREQHPDWDIRYRVTLGGTDWDWDSESITVPELTAEEASLLRYLPFLKTLDARGCRDYALVSTLAASHPEWDVHYSVALNGSEFPEDTESVTLKGAACAPLAENLRYLPRLQSLYLTDPDAEGSELLALREAYPEVEIHWQLDTCGQTVKDDALELDISGCVTSTGEAARIAAYCPNLEKLIMGDCGIDNEEMAAFREEKRSDYKVVWTVYFGKGRMAVRTDETSFMPWKAGIPAFQEFDSPTLCYCEDMVTVDVGHGGLYTIDFVRYMPHLKYLVLAHTNVRDLSPLACCKELIFLEVDYTYYVKDYTPLLECTALEDLNMGWNHTDWHFLEQMTWLKNLWWNSWSDPEMIPGLREALPNTRLEFFGIRSVDNGWRKLPNYYAMRDNLGMFYDT